MALKDIEYKGRDYSVSYEIHNKHQNKTIIFLHGWGSNKDAMRGAFAKELSDFKLLFIDMPGFGNSSIDMPLYTKEYAKIIEIFLRALHVQSDIVFGHSFGGKVATLLFPNTLVLLSSAGILNKKSLKTRVKIKLFKLLKSLSPRLMYKIFATKDVEGMSQTMYETLKRVVDEDFSDIFANFKGRALIYWGRDDDAVPLSNAYKIGSLISNSIVRVYEGGHFFFLNSAKQICQDFREDMQK